MSYLIDVTRTGFYNELNEIEREKYFSIKKDKYLPNIDNLYYVVFLENDDKDNPPNGVLELIDKLQYLREKVINAQKNLYYDENEYLIVKRIRYSIYDFCIGVNGFFDMFICSNIYTNDTPRIVVQLRADDLWTVGEYESLDNSLTVVKSFLEPFGLNVKFTRENRIDFAYHTNSIQNPKKFFSDKCLEDECCTSLRIFTKHGQKRGNKLKIEYLSLGNRKSNNIFFRSYDKITEVIDKKYKEFFINLWYENNLINFYDKFVYSYAYERKSVASIVKGKMQFYIEYGKNDNLKKQYKELLNNKSTNYEYLNKLIDGFLPECTLIMNCEFQTMRKFYYYGDNIINTLPIDKGHLHEELERVYKVIDNRKIFLDYLTSEVVSFRRRNYNPKDDEKKIYKNFWYRLRKVKLKNNYSCDYSRDYSLGLNEERVLKSLKSNLATYSLYKGSDGDFNNDMSLLLNVLNDNTIIDFDTGEILLIDNEYETMKENKKKALNPKLLVKNSRPSKK
jgi:hypothetical protein